MLFSSKFSKFGKGKHINAKLQDNSSISILYFDEGMNKKTLSITDNNIAVERQKLNLGFNEMIEINNNLYVTRIHKNIGIINHEQ